MTTRLDAHLPDFHREQAWKHPVVAATTANVTIATALNAGDVIDGVTLALNDRVLVRAQTAGAENGIYDVGPTPSRSYDLDSGVEAWGCIVRVLGGTTNGGKFFVNTNASLPTIGTTALTFAEFGVGFANPMTTQDDLIVGGAAGAPTRLAKGADGSILTVDPTTHHLVWLVPVAYTLTVKDEGSSLATGATSLDFVGAGVVASGTTAAKTITIPGGSTAADTYAWKPVLVNDPLVVTSDGHAVWLNLVTVAGEPVMGYAPL